MRSWTIATVALLWLVAPPAMALDVESALAQEQAQADMELAAVAEPQEAVEGEPADAPADPATTAADETEAAVSEQTQSAVSEQTQSAVSEQAQSVVSEETQLIESAPASPDPASESAEGPAELSSPAAPAPAAHQVVLGEVGYDANGQAGRIHVVIHGDTLWDISDAYLGTPWVWPSIWKDNQEISNPHLIHPGDRIWITPTEMRRVSPSEAAELLSATPLDPAAADEDLGDLAAIDDVPAAAEDSGPSAIPVPAGVPHDSGRTLNVPDIEMAGLVETAVLDAAASVVGSANERSFQTQGDRIYIGLGEGEVAVGDEFTIVRKQELVSDIETGATLGYYVATLGWARVVDVHEETASALVRMAVDTIEVGDPVLPREKRPTELTLRTAPSDIAGQIVLVAHNRLYMGTADTVFLNRGSIHGLEVGTELEVYDGGFLREDRVRKTEVQLPDEVAAHLVVIDVDPETATALVLDAEREVTLGDRFRARTEELAQAAR